MQRQRSLVSLRVNKNFIRLTYVHGILTKLWPKTTGRCTKWDGPWCKKGDGVMLREYSFHSVTLIVWHCDINCEVWKWTQPLESDHGDDPARIHSSLFSSLHWPPSSITLYCARFCCTPFLSNPLFCILWWSVDKFKVDSSQRLAVKSTVLEHTSQWIGGWRPYF